MFINCSNHKSSDWSQKQLEAAKEYGDVVEYYDNYHSDNNVMFKRRNI